MNNYTPNTPPEIMVDNSTTADVTIVQQSEVQAHSSQTTQGKRLWLIIAGIVIFSLLASFSYVVYKYLLPATSVLTDDSSEQPTTQPTLEEEVLLVSKMPDAQFLQFNGGPIIKYFENGVLQGKVIYDYNDEKYVSSNSEYHVGISKDHKVFFVISEDETDVTLFNPRGETIGNYTIEKSRDLRAGNIFIHGDTVLIAHLSASRIEDPNCDGVCQHVNTYEFILGNTQGKITEKFTVELGPSYTNQIMRVLWYDPTTQNAIVDIHGEPAALPFKLHIKDGKISELYNQTTALCLEANATSIVGASSRNDHELVFWSFDGAERIITVDPGEDLGCPVTDNNGNLFVRAGSKIYKIDIENTTLTQVQLGSAQEEVNLLRASFPDYGFDLAAVHNDEYLFRMNQFNDFRYIRSDITASDQDKVNRGLDGGVFGFLAPN